MSRIEKPGSRWNTSHLQNPATDTAHLQEPVQKIRRIRQGRLPGALCLTAVQTDPVVADAVTPDESMAARVDLGDYLGALRVFQAALQRNTDSYATWIGLSHLFESLADAQRAGQCRGVARKLRRFVPLRATS